MPRQLFLTIIEYLPFVLMVFISLPLHEFAHAYVANRLGDDTAYYQGRLSLNPLKHLDLFGTISMVLFHFGWAKPVPVNPMRFRGNMRRGMALVAVAGPTMNLILSFIFFVLSKLVILLYKFIPIEISFLLFLNWIFYTISITNIGLAFFNLIPIPPLDGSRILSYLLPYKAARFLDTVERYSFYILLGILFVDSRIGILSGIVSFLGTNILWLFDKITFFLGDAVYIPIGLLLQ
ncbi:MAG: site-2 protease family protein [Oscillospiraceae bacterium]|nr:site-2 protease family protein [Oscillospiraceae bacterium]